MRRVRWAAIIAVTSWLPGAWGGEQVGEAKIAGLVAAHDEYCDSARKLKELQTTVADRTLAEKRQQCLDRKKLYEQRQPLRLDWK